MTRLLVAAVLAGTVVIAGHAQSESVVISGRVAALDTGNPLPHARVVIYNDATPLPPLFTDAQGRFTSAPLPRGRYRLTATKSGYSLTTITRLDPLPADGVDVRMPRSGAISGRAIDVNGEPAIGMAISIALPRTGGPPSIVKTVGTDDLGEYRAGGLPAGTYVVAINQITLDPNGLVNRELSFFPGTTTAGDAQPIALASGDQKTGIDFTGALASPLPFATVAQLVNTPTLRISTGIPSALAAASPKGRSIIRGRVTRTDGVPIAHATVTASFAGMNGPITGAPVPMFPKSAQTDENGRYEITEIPRANYRVTASKGGYTQTAWRQQPGTDLPPAVSVGDDDIHAQIDITLPKFGGISGQVFDDFGDPIEGVSVTASQIRFVDGRRRLSGVNNANGATQQTTDDLGRYRLFGLPPGQYVITATVGQVAAFIAGGPVAAFVAGGTDLSGFAPTYFPGTTTANEARQVAVGRAQDVSGIDIGLIPQPTARITGKKIGADGQPLGGSLVLMQSLRSGAIITPPAGARIEQDGRFEFPNVAPGEYVIQASRGKASQGVEGEFVSQFVTVNGTDVSGLLLEGTPGSSISGRVVFDGDGQPPPLTFGIVPARADADRAPLNGGEIARGEVRRDLTFEMAGIHGPRRLMLDRRPSGWDLKAVVANGVDVTDVALPFGTRDNSLSDVQIILTDRLTELSGTVSDSRGNNISEYALLVFSSDRERWYQGSRFFRRSGPQAAGNFSVTGLPPGDYFVAPVPLGTSVLREGVDAWQDPEFLETISARAARATLTDGQKLSISARVITP